MTKTSDCQANDTENKALETKDQEASEHFHACGQAVLHKRNEMLGLNAAKQSAIAPCQTTEYMERPVPGNAGVKLLGMRKIQMNGHRPVILRRQQGMKSYMAPMVSDGAP